MKKNSKYIVFSLLVASVLAIASTGCNTAHGFGKDVENTGESIQKNTN
jgi:predicted small secreted protein